MTWVAGLFLWLGASPSPDANADAFERRVRPILAQHCFRCHNNGSRSKGGLSFESRETLLAGGSRGPAAVAGKPDESLILSAVKRLGKLQMPPDAPLRSAEIAILEEWVRAGLPWPTPPRTEATGPAGNTKQARNLWVLEPMAETPPPITPTSTLSIADSRNQNSSQSDSNAIDSFLRVELESAGLSLGPATDRLTWIRRASFDLLGLPPSKDEVLSFVSDDRPDARDRFTDRGLASPHYAERWARHWLDLVRYAETNGHEEDSVKASAFRYRDYVLDAFNIDLPYDQFVREHIAGDLLPERRSLDGQRIMSSSASGFWWLGEMMHLPFDPVELQRVNANEIEGQIDTFGKAFLGLTIACARCHDHKFDPITMEDYYAIAGTLSSTTNRQQCIESPELFGQTEKMHERITAIDREVQQILASPDASAVAARARRETSRKVLAQLIEVLRILQGSGGESSADPDLTIRNPWWKVIAPDTAINNPFVFGLRRICTSSESTVARRLEMMLQRVQEKNREFTLSVDSKRLFSDFEGAGFDGWQPTGHAFGSGPISREEGPFIGSVGRRYVSSARGGTKQTGRLVSPVFRSNDHDRYLCFFLAGGNYPRQTCVNLILHSQACPQNMPFWSVVGDGSRQFVFRYVDLGFYEDMDLFLEIVDDHSGEMGYIAADHFFFSSRLPSENQILLNQVVVESLRGSTSIEDIATRYGRLIEQVLDRIEKGQTYDPNPHWNALIDWIRGPESPLLTHEQWVAMLPPATRDRLNQLQEERGRLEEELPRSKLAMVSVDRPRVANAKRQISADPTELGDEVRRGQPPRLLPPASTSTPLGSGRIELADWTTRADNPILARVYVNRLWKHHFGRGLVGTPDNFGKMGDPCSHPALLDFLANRLIESPWSTKAIHRLIMTSSAYAQSSAETSAGAEKDPENRLVHRMAIRRLEGEAIRDATLLAANTLDERKREGSCSLIVPDPFMIQPVQTPGVLPSDRCRSIYLQVMRNHVPTLMTAFDFPQLSQTAGQRTSFSVPRQSLELLNGDFSNAISKEWGEELSRLTRTEESRIEDLYWSALSRPPRTDEIASAKALLADQRGLYSQMGKPSQAEAAAWSDLCHIIFNVSEFIFVR
jgi:hypothetical protein